MTSSGLTLNARSSPAVGAAGELPAERGAELLDVAREEFTQGLQVTATISAAVMVAIAVMAAALLRRERAGAEPLPA